MSSFICSPKHFSSIRKSLQDLQKFDNSWNGYGSPFKTSAEIDTFVDGLIWLNVVCVNFQYRHHNDGKLDTVISSDMEAAKTPTRAKHLSIRGLYNALRCTNYQIETEHITGLFDLQVSETMPILRKLLDSLAHKILSKLPDDETNTWEVC